MVTVMVTRKLLIRLAVTTVTSVTMAFLGRVGKALESPDYDLPGPIRSENEVLLFSMVTLVTVVTSFIFR